MLFCVNSMYIIAVMTIKTHFQILQHQLRTILFTRSREDSFHLRNLIEYHVEILDLTDSVNKLFHIIFFTQTTLTTLQICLTIFQILELSDSFITTLPSSCLLVMVFIELFVFCYGGEVITSESFNVSLAIQESCWYDLRPNDRSTILVMMARAQKPLIITSGLFDASLSMFMKVGLG